MANQEQEINQQPEATKQANGSLAVHIPEDTTPPAVVAPELAFEGSTTAPELAEAETAPVVDAQSDEVGDPDTMTNSTATPVDSSTPVASSDEITEAPEAASAIITEPVVEAPTLRLFRS
ncbi:hypothetical protein GO730_02965 [Spirosoma sp. HMF3257]|uniref:Uncharacterized protein n=1 Tax=Spirosoma telluris TaxID=2183553 RepID=A0A327NI75_9BACT|nr:hypothetical protein [Spirosoma telluris]RAI73634.1 hypothetical protein HMF3257_02900 [Spirosoma telluris]